MKTLTTTCQYFINKMDEKGCTLGLYSIVEDGKKITYEVRKEFENKFNSHGDVISEREIFDNMKDAQECLEIERLGIK